MACVDCVKGYTRTDKKPTGRKETRYDLPTYIAEPPPNTSIKGLIVIVPDAFGWEFVNSQILADTYAQAGFRVYLPDFMAGVSVPLYFMKSMDRLSSFSTVWDILTKPSDFFWVVRGIVPFIWYNLPAASHPRVVKFLELIRRKPMEGDRSLPIMAAGFCWGGKHVIMLTHKHEAHLIEGVFTAHPSALSIPQDIESITKPVSIAIGTEDTWLTQDQTKDVMKIFKQLDGKTVDMRSEVVIYNDAAHGFSTRIDLRNPKQAEQAQQAEQQAINWFTDLATRST